MFFWCTLVPFWCQNAPKWSRSLLPFLVILGLLAPQWGLRGPLGTILVAILVLAPPFGCHFGDILVPHASFREPCWWFGWPFVIIFWSFPWPLWNHFGMSLPPWDLCVFCAIFMLDVSNTILKTLNKKPYANRGASNVGRGRGKPLPQALGKEGVLCET